ncbi:MAG: ThuA domain-containing protein, partial [Bacteroidia bacterium]|nr:ThuA domain-containing protein [Bacteroidia bacterium]
MKLFFSPFIVLAFSLQIQPIMAQCGGPFRVLHYTETTGYDHNTRNVSLAMFQALGLSNGFGVTHDNSGAYFSSLDSLSEFAVIIFSNTSGQNGLDSLQRANLRSYIESGGSYLGIHAAGDTYRHSSTNGNSKGSWDWYAENLSGASVRQGPSHTHWSLVDTLFHAIPAHPSVQSIPDPWVKQEEFYYWQNGGYLDSAFAAAMFVQNTGNNSYDSSRVMAHYKVHPSGGRSFYTALGHAPVNFTSDTTFRRFILQALLWAAEPNLPSSIAVQTSITSDSCGLATGAISLVPQDSTSKYSFTWMHGDSLASISGLTAGTYVVEIADSAGCSVIDSFEVQASGSGLLAQLQVVQPILCAGDSAGSLQVTVSGAASAFSIVWSNGETDSVITQLSAGVYSAFISDTSGCGASASITLTQPAAISSTLTISSAISCFGANDGALAIAASGGMAPFTFLWS